MSDRHDPPLENFDRAGRTRTASRLLAEEYGRPLRARDRERADPVAHLVRVIVAQNTSRANQRLALAALHARFPDLAMIAEAPLIDLIDAIYPAGLANQKGPRLKAMIAELLERTDGTLDLSALASMPVDEAREYLISLPGIGPLSASLLLLFTLERPVLPVNTGLHRVAQRVGMIPPTVGAPRAHALLQAALADDEIYPFHINAVRLARERCRASRPRCDGCPLAPICLWLHGGGSVPPDGG